MLWHFHWFSLTLSRLASLMRKKQPDLTEMAFFFFFETKVCIFQSTTSHFYAAIQRWRFPSATKPIYTFILFAFNFREKKWRSEWEKKNEEESEKKRMIKLHTHTHTHDVPSSQSLQAVLPVALSAVLN